MATIYIDVELERKKVIKQMKDLEKELEKSVKRMEKRTKIDLKYKVNKSDIKKTEESVKKSTKKTQKLINDIDAELQLVIDDNKAYDKIEKFSRDTGKKLDNLEYIELQANIDDVQFKLEKLRKLKSTLKKEGIIDEQKVKSVNRAISRTSSELTEAKAKLKNLQNTGDKVSSRLGRHFDRLGTKANSTFGKIKTTALATFAAIGGSALFRSIFGSSAEIEQIRTSFNLLLGDTKEAGKLLDEIADFSSRTPFKFPEIADGSRKLMSVAGVAKNELIPTLTALGDIAANQSKGIDQTIEAFNDAITGEFERLKEFGILASSNGDKVTFTYKEQEKTVAKTSDSIREYLLELSKAKGVAGSMEEQSKTLNGIISTLKDNFGFLTKAIFGMSASGDVLDGGVIYYIGKLADFTGSLISKYSEWAKNNKKLAGSIGVVTAGLGFLAIAIGGVGIASTLLLPGLIAIGGFLAPFAGIIAGVTAGITAFGLAYKNNFLGFSDAVNSVISYISQKFGDEIKIIFGGLIDFLSGVFSIISSMLQWVNGLFQKSGEEIGIFGKIFKSTFQIIGVIFKNFMSILEYGLGTIGNLFSIFGKALQGDFKGAFDGIINIVEGFKGLLKNLFRDTMQGSLDIVGNFSEKYKQYGKNLITAFSDGIKEKIKAVGDSVKEVAQEVFSWLGVNSPTEKGPLAVDQSKWGKNLVNAIAKGIKSQIPNIKKSVEDIATEMAEIDKLQDKYKTQNSLDARVSKLNKKIGTLEYGSERFNNTTKELKLLSDLSRKYSGEKTSQEEKLHNLQQKSFEENIEYIDEQSNKQLGLEKDLLESFKQKRKALENLNELQKDENLTAEQHQKINEKIIGYKKEMKNISTQIFNEEQRQLEEIGKSIESLQEKAQDLVNDKDKDIAQRKLDIEKERKKVLEDIAKIENRGSLGRTGEKVKNIDEQLEGNISETKRNRLLEKRENLLEQINKKILTENRLNGEAYELKKKLLELQNEEKLVDANVNSETLQGVREDGNKSKTKKILEKYEEEKNKIEENLAIQIDALDQEGEQHKNLIALKDIGEKTFTQTIISETNKRISEQARLLDDARRVAYEMAALGFNGQGFKATFKKTNAEGKTTKVTRTVNITNNNTIQNNIDIRKQSRIQAKQIARAERSGNIY